MVEPYSCGLGGGGFMTIRDGRSGRITTIDSRETSPKDMKPDSFFINGQPPTDAQFTINRYSGLSVGVPGTPALWECVLRRYGTISLAKALSYGASVARNGFTVDQTFFDPTRRTSTTSRQPRRSTSTPTARRATSARRSRTPISRTRTTCSAAWPRRSRTWTRTRTLGAPAHHGRGDHGGRNNLSFLAVAEPTRRGGGSAGVVSPAAMVTSGR